MDDIFNEPLLDFGNYKQTKDKPRDGESNMRKYADKKSGQELAFKPIVNKEASNINSIKNQVTILKKLQDCENIIRFYGLSNDGTNHYLVTEWAENGNLREYIEFNKKNFELQLKIKFATDIALGLSFLSAVKIVHRDLKAKNIVITRDNIAKITNFKLSRSFGDSTGNISVGKESVLYCAPEILKRQLGDSKGCGKYNDKCEIYSFGIVLWEIAECRVPYDQFEDFMEITKEVSNGYREKFSSTTKIPKEYKKLALKAVDQKPTVRPTIAKMLKTLKDLQGSAPPSSSGPSSISGPPASSVADAGDLSIEQIVKEAVNEHKKNVKDKGELYKIFHKYAVMGVPEAKYWKAYYIQKDWSDIKDKSQNEKLKIAKDLFKEVADYGNEYPEAQLRYATMIMQGKGDERNVEEAIKYFRKAAENGSPVAMFNLATFYLSNKNEELGRLYLTKAAGSKYEPAIKYCITRKIPYS